MFINLVFNINCVFFIQKDFILKVMNKPVAKDTPSVNFTYKSLGSSGRETTRRVIPKQKIRHKPNKTIIIVPKKQFNETFTQTEEDCVTDVNQLTKAAQVIYSFCHANGGEILHTEKVLEESTKILQALSLLNKSFDFSDIPESIPFTRKLKEEIKSIEKCQKRCKELISSEELRTFLPKSKLTSGNLLVHCRCLLEEFSHRERKFRQAVLSIVESENLGKTKAEAILSQTDHKEQIHNLVESVVDKQRDSTDKDKSELHEQYKDISIKQKNEIQKLKMRVEKFEEEKEKINEECREKVIEIQQDVKKCNEFWEKQQQGLLKEQEILESEKMKMAKLLEDEKHRVTQKENENKKLQKLYHDTKEKLKEMEKLNYNMSKARRKSQKKTEDKGCHANLRLESENVSCQTDSAPTTMQETVKTVSKPTTTSTPLPASNQENLEPRYQNHFHGSISNINLYQIFHDRVSTSSSHQRDSAHTGRSSRSHLHVSSSSSTRHHRTAQHSHNMTMERYEASEIAMRCESNISFANPESLHGDDYIQE